MSIRILFLILAAQLTACATPSMPDVDKASSQKSAPVATPEPAARPSALSYGSVTSHVEKNKTTQTDLVEAFGGPNISSVDTDGTEVWVYERSVTQSDVSTQSKDYLGAVNLGVSFGYPHFGANAGASGSAEKRSGQSSTSYSTRTLTVVVKFNTDKTVKDYSARASTF
jgi:hypothetical protein